MRKFLQFLLSHLNSFLGNTLSSSHVNSSTTAISYLDSIKLAIFKKSAIHVIYNNKSFTGEIMKFDEERQQLILKNFKKNITVIISIKDIQRVSLVPETIKMSQKKVQHTKKLSS